MHGLWLFEISVWHDWGAGVIQVNVCFHLTSSTVCVQTYSVVVRGLRDVGTRGN